MRPETAYTSQALLQSYDDRHFGGPTGRYIFDRDCAALDALLGNRVGLLLDVPCGTGVYAQRFQANGHRVIAADASLPMLGIAGRRQENLPRVLCDINHLPFGDGVFDAVMTIRLFQHFPAEDVARALKELGRIIKPDGLVIFDTFRWTPRNIPPFCWFLDRSPMYVWSPGDVHHFLQSAALRKVGTVSLYLFSPIWQRKLPLLIVRVLRAIEKILPSRWLLRTFWACTRDETRICANHVGSST